MPFQPPVRSTEPARRREPRLRRVSLSLILMLCSHGLCQGQSPKARDSTSSADFRQYPTMVLPGQGDSNQAYRTGQDEPGAGPGREGAGGGAPASPSASEGYPIKTIWDYQEPLGLTNDQVNRMQGILRELKVSMDQLQVRLNQLQERVQNMVRNNAPMGLIRSALQEAANIKVEIRFRDILASRQINATMTADQLNMWQRIQAENRRSSAP